MKKNEKEEKRSVVERTPGRDGKSPPQCLTLARLLPDMLWKHYAAKPERANEQR